VFYLAVTVYPEWIDVRGAEPALLLHNLTLTVNSKQIKSGFYPAGTRLVCSCLSFPFILGGGLVPIVTIGLPYKSVFHPKN
jgi:hypothetical protein